MLLKPTSTYNANGVTMNVFLLNENNPNRIDLPGKRVKTLLGPTFHNTEDLDEVHDDAEQYVRATYNGNMKNVRVHAYIDDVGGWQCLPFDYQNWSCADGDGDGNTATIAIEVIMDGTNSNASKKALENAAKFGAWLIEKYGTPENQIYTHTHWLNVEDGHRGGIDELNTKWHPYKVCPIWIIPEWKNFKNMIENYLIDSPTVEEAAPEIFEEYVIRVIDRDPNGLNVRNAPGFEGQVVMTIPYGGAYTIVEEAHASGMIWGKLKSGAGWVGLNNNYVRRL